MGLHGGRAAADSGSKPARRGELSLRDAVMRGHGIVKDVMMSGC
ncbi:MAG TPA: hypothetical protein VFB46_11540 [Gemmatimonadaceae bacterium]|nr:hypothetical protein [Gemmatimonadaceae bacterium]